MRLSRRRGLLAQRRIEAVPVSGHLIGHELPLLGRVWMSRPSRQHAEDRSVPGGLLQPQSPRLRRTPGARLRGDRRRFGLALRLVADVSIHPLRCYSTRR